MSRNRNTAIWAAAIAAAMMSLVCHGKRPAYTLEELAGHSQLIVLGGVTLLQTSPVLKGETLDSVFVGSIEVDACFKRMQGRLAQPLRKFDFLFLSGGAESASVTSGDSYIAFLTMSEVGPHPTNGRDSMLLVKDGLVHAGALLGQTATVEFETFRNRLHRVAGDCGK